MKISLYQDGVAAQVLSSFDITYDSVREELENILRGAPSNPMIGTQRSTRPDSHRFARGLKEKLDLNIRRGNEIQWFDKISTGKKSQINELRNYLDTCRELMPKDFRFPYYLGLLEAREGNSKDALRLLLEAKKNSNNDGVVYQLALCRASIGETKAAEKELETLCQSKANETIRKRSLLSLAALKMQQGKWSEAADVLLSQEVIK